MRQSNADIIDLPVGMSTISQVSPLDREFGKWGYYGEAGFGIENIFSVGRIDFLWRLTQQGKEGTTAWTIRFAIQPKL